MNLVFLGVLESEIWGDMQGRQAHNDSHKDKKR
jgi:hypothetical protein